MALSGTAEGTIASVANKVAYGGSAFGVLAGVSGADLFTAATGLLIGLGGLCVQVYYKRRANAREDKADQRAAEEHAARMDLYRQGIDPRE
jgi:hypothetical protein